MGKTMTGGTTRKGNVSMLTPEQQQVFSSVLSGLGPQFQETLGGMIGGRSPEEMQSTFQQAYVEPATQAFEQQIVPGIQQRFVDVDAGSSSALNQALASSASNLATGLGTQFGQMQENDLQRQLQSLGLFQGMAGQQTFQPQFQQQEGIAGPLMQAIAMMASGAMMSSIAVKENVKAYEKGLDVVKGIKVRQYDYIEAVGGEKDKVGLIAEELPEELTAKKDEILHVDLYGLMGLLLNAIKELNEKVRTLEAK